MFYSKYWHNIRKWLWAHHLGDSYLYIYYCHFSPGERILETAKRHKELQIILQVLFPNKIKLRTLKTLLTITFGVLWQQK